MAAWAYGALWALAALAVFVAPTLTSAQNRVVSEIVIEGEQRIEEETILSYLQVSVGDTVDAETINNALKRLFSTGLFQDVRITPRSDGVLLVQVSENPVINRVVFEGNSELDDDFLQAQIRSRPRTAFTRARAESDAQTVLDAYRASGRFSATVEPKIIARSNNRVDLVFEITEGDEVGVNAISFIGNSEFSDGRLRRVIETSESAFWRILATTDNYDPDRLEFDKELLRRFYFSRGYADFEVLSAVAELNPERDGFFITFTVSEGERYDVGDVQVVSDVPGVSPEEFDELVETDQGDTYDADLVQRTVTRMQQRAGSRSINFINFRPEATKRRTEEGVPVVDLTYRIVEAPRVYVERIEIQGNSRTLDRVIRREFEFVEGDAFNAFKLQQSRANVRRLGYFSNVNVETLRGSSEDRVVIRTTVTEQSTGDITFGLGFSTTDSVGGQIALTERNFLGRGQFVRLSASLTADRQFFEFRFTEPYFLGRDLRAGIDVFHTEVDNQDESSFDTRRTGFSPRIGFPINDDSRVSFTYTFQRDEISDVPSDASPLVQQDIGTRLVSSVGYSFSYDQRNNPNTPTAGFYFTASQTFAGIGGDARYVRSVANWKGYQALFNEDIVASLELEGGAMFGFGGDDDIKINDRFRLGGDSFLGFASSGIGPRDTNSSSNDSLGGNFYSVARASVSFPIGLPEEFGVYGGVFANVGTLWGLEEDSYTVDGETFVIDDSAKLRATAGFSIFWSSPFGPVRLNFSAPIVSQDEDETEFFSFTAGTRF